MSLALLADGATDASSSNLASSSSSTPPTTVADSVSEADVITVAVRRRSGRVSAVSPVYNLSKLSGTDCHGRRQAKDAVATDPPTTTMTTTTTTTTTTTSTTTTTLTTAASPSTPRTRRQARQCLDSPLAPALTARLSALGKRSLRLPRELRLLQDTDEYAGIDDRPVLHTVWSNGKYVDPDQPPPPARNRKMPTAQDEDAQDEDAHDANNANDDAPEPITNTRKRRVKKYLDKGLYAGQPTPLDPTKGLSPAEKKKLAQLPELRPSASVNSAMPLPIYNGLRALIAGRDFKLPYNICNPLPPGQPKPDEWKKMTKNRFIGHAKEYWRKMPHLDDYQSKCVCDADDGCGESCQNRIMLYECDATNCNVGKDHCTNRAFADLTARRARGGKFRVGVEVIKTADRGYGVRSNRCFRPNQIIMEYTGEIITEEECERRMNDIYKDNECYYLMSFDQNMIIDATTGSIARFVNHSCNPNCRMIKWIVSGQPRVALFAGDRPILTGDELTYDYNFDPFSAKNVQTCLCGEPNCRGVLGPKTPKPPSKVKPTIKAAVKAVKAAKPAVQAVLKAGKRKLKELVGDDDAASGKGAKRLKCQPAGARTKTKSSPDAVSKVPRKTTKTTVGKKTTMDKKTTTVSKKTTAGLLVTSNSKKSTTSPMATKARNKAASTVTVSNKIVSSTGKKRSVPRLKAAAAHAKRRVVLKKKHTSAMMAKEAESPRASSPTTIVAKAGDVLSTSSDQGVAAEERVPTPPRAEAVVQNGAAVALMVAG
ncbi:hypothetical protein CDD80_6637 [Ophiocordyceps camponoti-rufipedis]|uniref:Histone-lysine N-methyltransferase n=1 Tax=Ophiocordyceps camponoti-rufipedis TaxID=2004952 RepID=A0A2C5YRQ4_9HYPO|nr:hypothetical protein CDD80_6637 [Ophiocordyceps camponoti-rufipedis]